MQYREIALLRSEKFASPSGGAIVRMYEFQTGIDP
jgi:hypothetical protein